jgi:hypothetical protein
MTSNREFKPWPEERLLLAEHLWKSGFKARYCAEQCGVSRNAFLGMVHRRKWKQDPDLVDGERRRERPQERRVRTRRERLRVAKPKPSRTIPEAKIGKITLMELDIDTCRWPVSGDGASTLFCGRTRDKSKESLVYCPEHQTLNIRPGNLPKLRVPKP